MDEGLKHGEILGVNRFRKKLSDPCRLALSREAWSAVQESLGNRLFSATSAIDSAARLAIYNSWWAGDAIWVKV